MLLPLTANTLKIQQRESEGECEEGRRKKKRRKDDIYCKLYFFITVEETVLEQKTK